MQKSSSVLLACDLVLPPVDEPEVGPLLVHLVELVPVLGHLRSEHGASERSEPGRQHDTVRALGVLEGNAAEVRGAGQGPAERELPGLPQCLELGAVDGVGGDELFDVGVGPLGEGLIAAVDLLEVVEEGEVARPVLLHALKVLADPHRRRRRRFHPPPP